ncbi:MAG TPA: alpha/beta fold hydrolase [Pyrinomonadaceae bacterium]|nr:alpha/beta fold hydrolase [Pyrinomonadaceae bacterium]
MIATSISNTHWVNFPHPVPDAKLRLFCFPYAGGTSLTYRGWPLALPLDVEVCAIQLPGHGNRLHEPLFDRLAPLIDDFVPKLIGYLDKPFVFFGHSMGALLAFETARRLRRDYARLPEHLFISGHRPAQTRDTTRRTFDLPEPEFIEELRRLDGTPSEVLDHPELLEMMIPILRADFAIAQTYQYVDEPPLECDLTAFGGMNDTSVTREHLEVWRTHTSGNFKLRMFLGNHFYLHSARTALLQTIALDLRQLI